MEGGRRARASSSATPQNVSEESASSKSKRVMSAVSPVGPGAGARRERRGLVSKPGAGRATGASESQDNRAGSTGSKGWQGRRLGSRSCWRVAWSPGAKGRSGERVERRRARHGGLSGPLCQHAAQRRARTRKLEGSEAVEASRRSEAHTPLWKAVMRARKTAAGMQVAAWAGTKACGGGRPLQARSDSTLVAAAARDWICDKAKCMAWRSGPRKSFGEGVT